MKPCLRSRIPSLPRRDGAKRRGGCFPRGTSPCEQPPRPLRSKVASRHFLQVASTPPWKGGEFALLVLLFISISACSASHEPTTIRMAVGGQTQFIYLPLTLADQLGYFKDEGLTVQISDLHGGSEALAALLGGSVDMVTGFYDHT